MAWQITTNIQKVIHKRKGSFYLTCYLYTDLSTLSTKFLHEFNHDLHKESGWKNLYIFINRKKYDKNLRYSLDKKVNWHTAITQGDLNINLIKFV